MTTGRWVVGIIGLVALTSAGIALWLALNAWGPSQAYTQPTPSISPSTLSDAVLECIEENKDITFPEVPTVSLTEICVPWVAINDGELALALGSPEGFTVNVGPTVQGQLRLVVDEEWGDEVKAWASQYGDAIVVETLPVGVGGTY